MRQGLRGGGRRTAVSGSGLNRLQASSVKGDNSAIFADADPVQRAVQGIQGIEQGFRFSFSSLSP